MKVVYLKTPGRLLRLAAGDTATSTQAHEYQALIATKLHARARLDEIEARIVDETWRQMLIQAGKHPLPNQ